ncbi:hypothetical protein [Asanoa siamensis]|uniref:Uncharacterized protein n=1 Tax=Asanoa siamensis TaxID=926357 RepID=A0ABQ4CNE9_9ACTN|nr:hypothetical protein [Asanoa siamensis]GIF72812.1 hypothetical protein Asi02nite_23300 [Asanoa siamensis]
MTSEAEVWLAGEVRDHLHDFGAVGLYELVWLLRGSSFGLADDDAVEVARRVARGVLAGGAVGIYRLAWPGAAVVDGPLDPQVLSSAEAWQEGERYLALVEGGGR